MTSQMIFEIFRVFSSRYTRHITVGHVRWNESEELRYTRMLICSRTFVSPIETLVSVCSTWNLNTRQ